MRVREDVALGRNDEAGSLRFLGGEAVAVDRVDGHDAGRTGRVDPARIKASAAERFRARRQGGLSVSRPPGQPQASARRPFSSFRCSANRPLFRPPGRKCRRSRRRRSRQSRENRAVAHGSHCSCVRSRRRRGSRGRAAHELVQRAGVEDGRRRSTHHRVRQATFLQTWPFRPFSHETVGVVEPKLTGAQKAHFWRVRVSRA